MGSARVKVTPITPDLGAEISDIDLSQSLSPDLFQALQTAFNRHHVLVFRDQALTRDQHKDFARQFGPIHIHPSKKQLSTKDDPEIFLIDIKPDAKQSNGETWHADITCEEIPPYASMLYLTQLPENGGGDTLFANMQAAYAELSSDLQVYLRTKRALHDGEIDLARYGIRLKGNQTYPANSHPVVIAHPKTGMPTLYVNEGFTSHLLGVPRFESDLILSGLFNRLETNPRHQCRIRWTPNMMTLWDNYSVQHQAIFDYAGFARYGERITIAATTPPQAFTRTSMDQA